ncbi:MAG: type II toxin-antitoxin system VapC family toxin [Cyanobacteriota bacterium]|nr:type II toxin-antitoxin system VapC family toxin [Cyanobacteriota bacterium]
MTVAMAPGDCVLDVSLTCAWCFADEASDEAWGILAGLEQAQAHVPALWLWEITNVLIQAERRGRITTAVIRRFLGLLETLPIVIDPAGALCAWHDTLSLARSHRLTAYDAAYLELALRLGLPLASRDQALNAAAGREGVRLLPT